MNKIKYVIETISSKPDVYGNRYHSATIYRTSDGKSIRIKSIGGESNARYMVTHMMAAAGDSDTYYPAILDVHKDLPIREYNRVLKYGTWNYAYNGFETLIELFDSEE